MFQLLRLSIIALIILISNPAYAVVGMKESDSSPDNYFYQVIVSPGTLTDNGDGTASYDPSAGTGGDNVSVDASAVVDPNFASTGDIDFVNTANTVTANLNADSIVAADFADADWGDITVATNVVSVEDDSHAHTTTTISGIDISSDTNLAGDTEIVLTGDALSIASTIARDTELPTQASLSVDDLITLSGVADGAVNLGTFTGTTITDNQTMKSALQLLETAVETKAPSTAPTFDTSITGSYLTASEILITDGSKNVVSAAVATYPSLTELSYVKGLTSAVQTQLNAKDSVTTAGDYLTRTTNDFDLDAEAVTETRCIYIEDPTADDDLESIWYAKNAFTISSLWCESDQTATVMLQVDDGTPADVDGTDLTCDSTPPEDTSLDGDATMAAGDRLDLDAVSVASTPTWVSICWTGKNDDV